MYNFASSKLILANFSKAERGGNFMKRVLCSILVVLTVMCAVAQEEKKDEIRMQVSGGVKAEANLSQYIMKPDYMVFNYGNMGFTTGGFLRLELEKNFSVQGELLMHYKCSTLTDSASYDLDYWGLEIPIYAMYTLRFKKGDSMNFGLGPYCEFGLKATLWEPTGKRNLYEPTRRDEIQAMAGSNSGFGVLIGYETTFGLQVNATYKISITNIVDANSNNVALYPMAASVGVAYRWGR